MATNDILELTDGTTTLDLLRGIVRLEQDGWAPGIATRRRSELGNVWEWDDVEEELNLYTQAATFGDNPGAQWTILQRLLAQAERWTTGDVSADPVQLRVRPAGSRLPSGDRFTAVVLGGEAPRLHTSFTRMLEAHVLSAVPVTIRRRGGWNIWRSSAVLYDTVDLSINTASQEVRTVNWPNGIETLCPAEFAITPDSSASIAAQQVAALVAPSASAFTLVNAEGLSPGGAYSSASGLNARSTNYLLYTPAGSTFVGANAATITSTREATVYLVAQAVNNAFEVYAEYWFQSGSYTGTSATTGITPIPAGVPRLISLGTIAAPNFPNRLKLWCRSPNGTTSSPLLRIDTLIVVAHDYGPHYAWAVEHAGATITNLSLATLYQHPLAHQMQPTAPMVATSDSATIWDNPIGLVPSTGDLAVQTQGSAMAILPVVTGTNSFRADQAASENLGIFARRYPTYLALE